MNCINYDYGKKTKRRNPKSIKESIDRVGRDYNPQVKESTDRLSLSGLANVLLSPERIDGLPQSLREKNALQEYLYNVFSVEAMYYITFVESIVKQQFEGLYYGGEHINQQLPINHYGDAYSPLVFVCHWK